MSDLITRYKAHSGLTFSIHPLAHGAYQWVLSYPRLISWQHLPSALIRQLGQQPLQGLMRYQASSKAGGKMRPAEFQLFAPLWPAVYWDDPNPPDGTLLIHNDASHQPSDDEIETQAWASALTLLVTSTDSRELSSLRDLFQAQLPSHMARWFFDKTRISDRDLCQWTGCSRGTLVQQRQRVAINTQPNEPISDPIELLNMDWSPDHG
ncbi:hypothetical protein ACV1CV_12665 [Aeromonas veronii]